MISLSLCSFFLCFFSIIVQGTLSLLTRQEGDYLNMGRHAMCTSVVAMAAIYTIPAFPIFMLIGAIFLLIYMFAMYQGLPKNKE